jgi:hypothetical protein
MKSRTLPTELRNTLDQLVEAAESGEAAVEPKAPPKTRRRAESFAALDKLTREAVAGMPDAALARAAHVSLTAVLEWRKERNITRRKGWLGRRDAEVYAIDAYGTGYINEIQAIESLKGQWDLPQYVLREALDYDLLSRAILFLRTDLSMTPAQIAKALGLRETDVEMASAVEVAHLERVGRACATCGRVCDPAYGPFCTTRCRETK